MEAKILDEAENTRDRTRAHAKYHEYLQEFIVLYDKTRIRNIKNIKHCNRPTNYEVTIFIVEMLESLGYRNRNVQCLKYHEDYSRLKENSHIRILIRYRGHVFTLHFIIPYSKIPDHYIPKSIHFIKYRRELYNGEEYWKWKENPQNINQKIPSSLWEQEQNRLEKIAFEIFTNIYDLPTNSNEVFLYEPEDECVEQAFVRVNNSVFYYLLKNAEGLPAPQPRQNVEGIPNHQQRNEVEGVANNINNDDNKDTNNDNNNDPNNNDNNNGLNNNDNNAPNNNANNDPNNNNNNIPNNRRHVNHNFRYNNQNGFYNNRN